MITSLSYDTILMPSEASLFVYFNDNLHCCHGRRHDVKGSHWKCYVTCGHNIIYDMYPLNKSDVIWQYRI